MELRVVVKLVMVVVDGDVVVFRDGEWLCWDPVGVVCPGWYWWVVLVVS